MVSSENCIGCGICAYYCPTDAIQLQRNEKGFWTINVEDEKCIHCNGCDRHCINTSIEDLKVLPKKCFAAYSGNNCEVALSSSGGLFTVLARIILQRGGVVYGACLDNKLKLRHIRIESVEDIRLIRGSKYIQSDIKDVFPELVRDLNSKKSVLFCGTPCQVAAIRKNTVPCDNLFLIDLLCHGVASPQFFEDYVSDIAKATGSKIVHFEFRNKELGYTPYGFKYRLQNNNEKIKDGAYTPFGKGFFNGLILRESCFTCQFADKRRTGDLTLGDFWGGNIEIPEFYKESGTSCVLINTDKGIELFNSAKNEMDSLEVELSQIAKGNHNLVGPTNQNSSYIEFWTDYATRGYDFVKSKYLKNSVRDVMQSQYHRLKWRKK